MVSPLVVPAVEDDVDALEKVPLRAEKIDLNTHGEWVSKQTAMTYTEKYLKPPQILEIHAKHWSSELCTAKTRARAKAALSVSSYCIVTVSALALSVAMTQ